MPSYHFEHSQSTCERLLLAVQATGVTCVVDGVGDRTLDTLRELLLKLLGDNGGSTTVLSMSLVGRLARLGASGVDLRRL